MTCLSLVRWVAAAKSVETAVFLDENVTACHGKKKKPHGDRNTLILLLTSLFRGMQSLMLLILPRPRPSLHGDFRTSCRQRATWCSASQVGTATSSSQQPQSEEPISDERSVAWRCRLSGLAGVTSESITPQTLSEKEKTHPFWCQRLNRNKRACGFCRHQREERVMAGRHAGRRRAASPLRHGGGFRDYRFISRWMAHTRMDWIFWGEGSWILWREL